MGCALHMRCADLYFMARKLYKRLNRKEKAMFISKVNSLFVAGTCSLLLLMVTGLGMMAHAQGDRAQGIRAGSLIFKPVLQLSEGYDSNIFEDTSGGTGSFITTVRPSLSLESDFSRHRIGASVGMRFETFHQSTDDNTYTAFAETEGVLDITRRLRVQANAGYERLAGQRGSDDVGTNIAGPVYSDRYRAGLSVQYLPGDFRIQPFVSVLLQDFIDRGQVVDQDDRDRASLVGGLEVGYRLAPGYEAFVRASYFDVNFLDAVDSAGIDRDSSGVNVLAGVNLKLSRLLNGSAGVGFVFSSFDDPAFQNTTDFTARVGLDWSPRRRWRLSLNGSRELTQTNVAGASDSIQTNLILAARYEIMRALNGFVRAGFNRDEFSGAGRTDTGFLLGTGLDWAMTRQVSLRLAYNYRQETSTDPTAEFSKHIVNAGLRYGL